MLEQVSEESLGRFLARVGDATVRKSDISLDDEMYYDLKIYGDPLFDLLHDLAEEYHTDFSALDVSRYAPGEGGELIRPLLIALGRRPFPSFKVGDVWRAVQAGHWVPEKQSEV